MRGRRRRAPDLASKNASQHGNPDPRDFDHLAMKIAAGQRGAKQVVIVLFAVVVSVDEPKFCFVQDGRELKLQRPLRLDISKQDQRCRPVLADSLDEVLEVSMNVPAKEDFVQA